MRVWCSLSLLLRQRAHQPLPRLQEVAGWMRCLRQQARDCSPNSQRRERRNANSHEPPKSQATDCGRSTRIVSTEAACAEKAELALMKIWDHAHSLSNECRICREPGADHSEVCDSCARGERSREELRGRNPEAGWERLVGARHYEVVIRHADGSVPSAICSGGGKSGVACRLRASFEAFYRLEISQQALPNAPVQQ